MTTQPSTQDAGLDRLARAADSDLRLARLSMAIGSSLIAALVLLSVQRARRPEQNLLDSFAGRGTGEIDWSVYGLGLLGVAGLLLFAAMLQLLVSDPERRALFLSWPLALAAVALGQVAQVALGDQRPANEVAGLLTLLGGVLAYLLVRRPAPVVAAVVGAAVLWTGLTAELVRVLDVGLNLSPLTAAATGLFVIVVTLAGWRLPERNLVGILAGGIAMFGYASTEALPGFWLTPVPSFREYVVHAPSSEAVFPDDAVAWDELLDRSGVSMLALVVALGVVWAICYRLSGHVGYLVLILAAVASAVPTAAGWMAITRPTSWEIALGIAGAGFLAFAGLRVRSAERSGPR